MGSSSDGPADLTDVPPVHPVSAKDIIPWLAKQLGTSNTILTHDGSVEFSPSGTGFLARVVLNTEPPIRRLTRVHDTRVLAAFEAEDLLSHMRAERDVGANFKAACLIAGILSSAGRGSSVLDVADGLNVDVVTASNLLTAMQKIELVTYSGGWLLTSDGIDALCLEH